jgi:peroxiredoxin
MKKIFVLLMFIFFSCNQSGNTSNYDNTAPDFSLPNLNNELVSLSDFKGKVVLIDFWASWCRPCRSANKKLVRLYDKYKSKNFEIIGVSLDGINSQNNASKDWIEAINEDKISWPNVSELKGWGTYLIDLYNVRSIPHAVLIDKNGKIIAEKISIKTLEKELEKILDANQN